MGARLGVSLSALGPSNGGMRWHGMRSGRGNTYRAARKITGAMSKLGAYMVCTSSTSVLSPAFSLYSMSALVVATSSCPVSSTPYP